MRRSCGLFVVMGLAMVTATGHGFVVTAPWSPPIAEVWVGLEPAGTSRFSKDFTDALNEWNSATKFHFGIAQKYLDSCKSEPAKHGAPPKIGAAFTDQDCDQNTLDGVFGLTQYEIENGALKWARIFFVRSVPWDVHTGPSQNRIDFRRVALHEAGHALGLGHELIKTAIMNEVYDGVEHLQPDDKDGLKKLYP